MSRVWKWVLFLILFFLLIVLQSALAPAKASDENIVGTLRNQLGGNITFSLLRNGCEAPYLFRMWSRSPTGSVAYGCWQYINDELHVRWDDGVIRFSVYSINNLKTTDWFNRRLEQNSDSSTAKPKNYY